MANPKMNHLEFLNSLKQRKKDGSLDSEESLHSQELKWRSILEYKTLENWLICDSEEVIKIIDATTQFLSVSNRCIL